MKKIFALLALCLVAICSYAQSPVNIPIGTIGPYITIGKGLSWAVSGIGGVNNAFLFTPLAPTESFCLSFVSYDASNAHTVTVQVFTTTDQSIANLILPSGALDTQHWKQIGAIGSSIITLEQLSTYNVSQPVSGAARIAIYLTSVTPTSTVDILLSQSLTSSGCGQFPVAYQSAWTSSESNSLFGNATWSKSACTVNPAAGQALLFIFPGTSATNIYLTRARYSSTVAGEIDLTGASGTTTGCTGGQVTKTLSYASIFSNAVVQTGCTALTESGNLIVTKDLVGASNPTEFDIRGAIIPSTNGVVGYALFTPVSITGTVCSSFEWYEQ